MDAELVDVSFALHGRALARDHRWLLAEALAGELPWLRDEPRAAIHPVRLVPGSGAQALLSARARLLLRVPRSRHAALAVLDGGTLAVGADAVTLADPRVRELLPHANLYAHFVDADGADETTFLDAAGAELERLQVRCHRVCGRAQALRGPAGPLEGFSLMLHGLTAPAALRVLEAGIGAHRLMGCGVFVPHKSAAAVGD